MRVGNVPTVSEPVLRQAEAGDVGAVRTLVEATYGHYVARIGRPPRPMTADYAALVEAGRVWVAESGGGLIGLLVLDAQPDHLLVENVAVVPTAQGSGVGTALLDFAETEAVRLGLAELRLYTNEKMTENIAYYPRRGFRETHRETSAGFRVVHFAKPVVGS